MGRSKERNQTEGLRDGPSNPSMKKKLKMLIERLFKLLSRPKLTKSCSAKRRRKVLL
jgi:hypothetical protein